jgi:hypothetical protein
MASKGMALMLQSFGIDPEKIKKDIEGMKEGVTKTLNEINQKLAEAETRQILTLKLVEEITAWKRQQMILQLQNQQPPPPIVPRPPNPAPAGPNIPPPLQP